MHTSSQNGGALTRGRAVALPWYNFVSIIIRLVYTWPLAAAAAQPTLSL